MMRSQIYLYLRCMTKARYVELNKLLQKNISKKLYFPGSPSKQKRIVFLNMIKILTSREI
jgi:hypothetical protein